MGEEAGCDQVQVMEASSAVQLALLGAVTCAAAGAAASHATAVAASTAAATRPAMVAAAAVTRASRSSAAEAPGRAVSTTRNINTPAGRVGGRV